MNKRLSLPDGLDHLIEKRDGPDRRNAGNQSKADEARGPCADDRHTDSSLEASAASDERVKEERRHAKRREVDRDSPQ